MLFISKPLSASQARTYHEPEFASEEQSYWSRDQRGLANGKGNLPINGTWLNSNKGT
jgi:hypothetical protein